MVREDGEAAFSHSECFDAAVMSLQQINLPDGTQVFRANCMKLNHFLAQTSSLNLACVCVLSLDPDGVC